MFDNPQQEVKKMSKKLRPVKMSDEEFELFYKEIYEEFGPKDTAPVAVNPQVPVEAPVEAPVAAPVEEPVVEESPLFTVGAHEHIPMDGFAPSANAVQAAAKIRNVQNDELIEDYTDGKKAPKKEKGIKGLVITLCLECLAIAGVVAYWMLYIL